MRTDTSAGPIPPIANETANRTAVRTRAFQVGLTLCIINTIIGAGQPVITRWGAVHVDPLLFCTGAVVFATLCTIPVLQFTGELRLIFDRRYRGRLFIVAMAGTVMTSLTLTYGLTRIGAVAGVLLLQTEPVYSLVLSRIFVGERRRYARCSRPQLSWLVSDRYSPAADHSHRCGRRRLFSRLRCSGRRRT
jgi:hypothetical protein